MDETHFSSPFDISYIKLSLFTFHGVKIYRALTVRPLIAS